MTTTDDPGRVNPDVIETTEKMKMSYVTNKDLEITRLELKAEIKKQISETQHMISDNDIGYITKLYKIENDIHSTGLKVNAVLWVLGVGIPGIFAVIGYLVKLILEIK